MRGEGQHLGPYLPAVPTCAGWWNLCPLLSTIKIDDAYRIMAWEQRGSRATERMSRWDKFAHTECVLTLFPDAEAPCADCGTPLHVRNLGLAPGPTLMRATDPLVARWYEFMDPGWTRVSFDPVGPGITCPHCGSMCPLSRSETCQTHCGHCRLPVLTAQEAEYEYDSSECSWFHRGCRQGRGESSALS